LTPATVTMIVATSSVNHSIVAVGWVDLAGLGIAVGALVYLHLAPTELSPLQNPVSQYGITPYRAGYRVQTIGLAVGGAAAAIGISCSRADVAPLLLRCCLSSRLRGPSSVGSRWTIRRDPRPVPATIMVCLPW
jgi:hypothetical protein